MPRPLVLFDWGSRSMMSTWAPRSASAAPRFMTVVVLPTPPFWFATAIVRGVKTTMLRPSCEDVVRSVDTAARILFGKSGCAYPAGKENRRREQDQGRLAGQGGDQPPLVDSQADQAVVGHVADDRRGGVGQPAQDAEAHGEHEDRRHVEREPVLGVHGGERDRGQDHAHSPLQHPSEEGLLANAGRQRYGCD